MSFLCVFVQRILLSIGKYESQISLLKVLQGQTSSQDLFSVKGPGTFSWLPCCLHSAPTNGKCEHQRIGSNVSLLMICYQKMVELYSYFIYLCSGGKGQIKISRSKSDSIEETFQKLTAAGQRQRFGLWSHWLRLAFCSSIWTTTENLNVY